MNDAFCAIFIHKSLKIVQKKSAKSNSISTNKCNSLFV